MKGGKRERKAAERGKQEVKMKENEWEKNSRKKKKEGRRGGGGGVETMLFRLKKMFFRFLFPKFR